MFSSMVGKREREKKEASTPTKFRPRERQMQEIPRDWCGVKVSVVLAMTTGLLV